jgi:hypothetical protein
VGVAIGGAAGAWGRGPGRQSRRLPGCRPAGRWWPRRLPWPSRCPPLPWLPVAGPPAGPRGPGALWSPRIVWASIWWNQPTRTRRPSTATRRGAESQASRLSATRVIGPREDSRPAMRPGSSASGSRERGHQPPSTAPVPVIVGSSCSRSPGGAGGRVGAGAVVRVLVAAGRLSALFSVPPCTALGCAQAARAGVGCGLGSGRGIGGTGVGAPGRLASGWVGWPGWLVGPLSQ